MRYFVLTLFAILVLSLSQVYARAGNPANASDSTTLRQQFDDMLRVSNRYRKFKVVNQDFLNAFISNVSDSISGYTREIDDLNQTITAQAKKIESLTENVAARDADVTALTEQKDSMNLLGSPLSKATYATVVWGLLFGLLALLVFTFLRMKVAIGSARAANDNGAQLSDELAKAKKQRLKVEQDLRRQLQDERNRNRG